MVYLNVKYVIATRNYEFFIYTQNLIDNITLSRVIISVASVNWGTKHIERYENVASLTIPLKNGIVTFYEDSTNKYVRVDKLGGGIHPLGILGI